VTTPRCIPTQYESWDFTKNVCGDYDARSLARLLVDRGRDLRVHSISAPHLGVSVRVFAIGNFNEPAATIVIFNPVVVDSSLEMVYYDESDAHTPGMLVRIKRPRSIRVRYSDVLGEVATFSYSGYTARLFQHEIDGLDGIDYISRATAYHREMAKRKYALQQRRSGRK